MHPEHLLRQHVPRDGSYSIDVSRKMLNRVEISKLDGDFDMDRMDRVVRVYMDWNAADDGASVRQSRIIK
jgi:hypothetical protein